MASQERAYAAGFFPTDDGMLAKRDTWSQWFLAKKSITDNKWVEIEDWINNAPEEDDILSDKELVVINDYDKLNESSADYNQNDMQIQRINNLQLKPAFRNELSETLDLIKNYFDDIVNSRVAHWRKTGIDRLLLSTSKTKSNAGTEKMDNWFENFDSFKGKVRIKETRTISYTRDSDSDSVDTAEYIRGARGKGNKSISGKNKNRIIKQYSYLKKIKSNKMIKVKQNKQFVEKHFPLDDSRNSHDINDKVKRKRRQKHAQLNKLESNSTASSSSPERTMSKVVKRNKQIVNKAHFPLDDSGSPQHNNIKIKRKRLQNISKAKLSRSHSSSSSSGGEVFQNGNRNFCSIHRLNRTHISSEYTDSSDQDDRVLSNIRKTHKDVVNQHPNQPESTSCNLNQTKEPIIEFPPDPEQQLVLYDRQICVANQPFVQIISSSEEDSENDIIFMSNKKRLRLYGQCFEEQPSGYHQSLILYKPSANTKCDSALDDSSTDDGLFKLKNYM